MIILMFLYAYINILIGYWHSKLEGHQATLKWELLANARQIHSTFGRGQLTDIFIFYYIVILKCMKDFIFYKITAIY